MTRRSATLVFLLSLLMFAVSPAFAQDAKALHEQALHEPNQEKQVQMLCKAADADRKNKDFRNDCDTARLEMIRADKNSLKMAFDANDAGNNAKAKRYAGYVSSTDPDTRHQAEQLLAKLTAPASSPGAAPQTAAVVPTSTGPSQSAVLAQAQSLYESGNLQGAKSTAQSITDPALKSLANRIAGDVDRYSSYVAEGHRHEQAKEYADAARSYQSAFDLNPHVSADDLAGRRQRLQQLASSPQAAPSPARPEPSKPTVAASNVPVAPPVSVSPDERKKRLLEESALAMSRNDLDGAGRKFKQVLEIDPGNAEAKRGLSDITAQLSKDPVRLERTLRDAIAAFYESHFEDAESKLNRYLGADGGKKKGAAFFYLGATEATLSLLEDASKRDSRTQQARDDFKQARSAGYLPVERYVSTRVLSVWKASGS